jgi:hypothetical protein
MVFGRRARGGKTVYDFEPGRHCSDGGNGVNITVRNAHYIAKFLMGGDRFQPFQFE